MILTVRQYIVFTFLATESMCGIAVTPSIDIMKSFMFVTTTGAVTDTGVQNRGPPSV